MGCVMVAICVNARFPLGEKQNVGPSQLDPCTTCPRFARGDNMSRDTQCACGWVCVKSARVAASLYEASGRVRSTAQNYLAG